MCNRLWFHIGSLLASFVGVGFIVNVVVPVFGFMLVHCWCIVGACLVCCSLDDPFLLEPMVPVVPLLRGFIC